MQIEIKTINDRWKEYILRNKDGIEIHFLNYGGIITRMYTPDREGRFENIVLNLKKYDYYKENPNYLGAIIGQVAGRIKDAKFSLKDKTYTLEKNEGENHLHGGSKGLHQVLWEVKPFKNENEVGASLFYKSVHNELGYPGAVQFIVTYRLSNHNEFTIDYLAETDRTTIIALTNHSYFNLTGNIKSTVVNHQLKMNANRFLELDKGLLPTGKVLPVKDTAFDFRSLTSIQDRLAIDHSQLQITNEGFDHYFLFEDGQEGHMTLFDPESGRSLEVRTTHPGVLLYTGNNLDYSVGIEGSNGKKHLGLCLETQEHAASLQLKQLPSIIVTKDKPYKKQTNFSFKVLNG